MVRLVSESADGRRLAILGIDAHNIERLKAGLPLWCHGSEMGIDCDIAVMYGDTQAELLRQMKAAGLDVPTNIAVPAPGETVVIKKPGGA